MCGVCGGGGGAGGGVCVVPFCPNRALEGISQHASTSSNVILDGELPLEHFEARAGVFDFGNLRLKRNRLIV